MAQTLVQVAQVVPVVEIQECPICLEEIVGLKNRVTTDCGHTFHCRCLLNNAAHNGFGCPFCRAELADEVEDSDDDEDEYDSDEDGPARYEDDSSDEDDDASRASDYDSEQDDLDGELEYIENQIVKMKEDHVLRGFRWMFQPINTDISEENISEENISEAAISEAAISEAAISEAEEEEEDNNHPMYFYSYP